MANSPPTQANLETMSLLDLLDGSPAGDQLKFPSLKPLSPISSGKGASPDPVIREGSPIELPSDDKDERPLVVPSGFGFFMPKKAATVTPEINFAVFKNANNATVGETTGKKEYRYGVPKSLSQTISLSVKLVQPRPLRAPAAITPSKQKQKTAGQPQWTLTKASVFDSDHEESLVARRVPVVVFDRNGANDNSFFQWGLRFIPRSPSAHDNVYRTVTIDHLPPHVTLDQILPRIRGGTIYSATLLDTNAIVQSYTALVVFVHQQGALAFLRRVAHEGFYIGISPAEVHPVPTPTYVIGADMDRQINRLGRTRCIVVSSPRARLRKVLHATLAKSPHGSSVECFGERDAPGEVTIRFFSVKVAIGAFVFLTQHVGFDDCKLRFAADPCA